MPRFFDEYSRFYQTTGTGLEPNRLYQRWRMIIDQNRALYHGARVLDLASHDGRWSFSALKAGAQFVKGVEARAELVRRAHENFAYYGVPSSCYHFVCEDAVKFLSENRMKFDIVLNLGFFLPYIETPGNLGGHG
jgi:23S rRNA G2069 N7-methylase RlmK/C1962 C5-methylase RlmI